MQYYRGDPIRDQGPAYLGSPMYHRQMKMTTGRTIYFEQSKELVQFNNKNLIQSNRKTCVFSIRNYRDRVITNKLFISKWKKKKQRKTLISEFNIHITKLFDFVHMQERIVFLNKAMLEILRMSVGKLFQRNGPTRVFLRAVLPRKFLLDLVW